ncbi:MAG: type II toxin-antitoxin system Phd/YefM family antitoxin [Eggerthellaceae bacterium]|nr:type II toxin-antitoxin system Phd/YefM family antitoxin [Eggerthellaceae bacterium]
MPTCVPVKDLRDTAAFVELVKASPEPITVTKNGYDEFVCVRSADYRRLEQAQARADLLARIAIAERERAQGDGVDAFEDIKAARLAYGL